jgi:trimethylamine---corrinoid protein Co-methyltransferase
MPQNQTMSLASSNRAGDVVRMNRAIVDFHRATLDNIHQFTLDLLADTGVRFANRKALDIFSSRGFTIHGDVVHFDRKSIESALETAPEVFTIAARNTDKSIVIGLDQYQMAPGYGPPFIIEPNGEKRHALLADAHLFYKLVHTSDYLDFNSSLVVQPHDVPAQRAHLDLLLAELTLTDKPIMGSPTSEQAAIDSIRMAEIVWGSLKQPVMISLINSLSPLQYSAEMIDAMMVFAASGQPVIIHSGCILGTTGPITTPGSLVMTNAATLAGICLTQLIRPGTPVVYGVSGSPTDMRSGGYVNGSPEDVKHVAISPAMGRYYGIPSRSHGAVTESFCLDYQAGMESAMMLTMAAISGAHVGLHACGTYGSMLAMSFEKFMADEELCGTIKTILEPVSFTEDTFAMELIRKVGFSGSYLVEDHTLQRCRSEFFLPKLNIRTGHDNWREMENREMVARATQSVTERIAAYQQPDMETSIKKALEQYMDSR